VKERREREREREKQKEEKGGKEGEGEWRRVLSREMHGKPFQLWVETKNGNRLALRAKV
jgi:hypothetical protein